MAKKAKPAEEDVALVVGASEDAESLAVLRKRGERVDAALLRKAREGQPVHGDLVRLRPREGSPLCDVETLHEGPSRAATQSGPAQVASDRYRKGWSRLFRGKRPGKALPN